MANSSRSASSDWYQLLLERPEEEVPEAKPLSWLPEFSGPQSGFRQGMPFDPPVAESIPETVSDIAPEPEAATGEPQDGQAGDALEDILRKALAQGNEEGEDSDPAPAPAFETPPQAEADPLAEAFERGEAAGRQAAEDQHQQLADQKLALRQTFRTLDQAAMDALANDLAETVIALCSQTLADFIPAPEALRKRCDDAARRLGSGASGAVLHLHPDDLTLIDQSGLEGWTIVGDPAAERGGLRLETSDGQVSDRPADWRRAIAAAIKG